MSARFVVESPFQLLMANEARRQLALEDPELVVLWPSGASSRQSIADVLDATRWPHVVDGGVRSRTAMASRARLTRELAASPRDHLYVGDYLSPFMRHLLVAQPAGTAHLLDDGRGTVNTWNLRVHPDRDHPRADTRTWHRRAVLRALRLSDDHPDVLRYFTIFDLEQTPTNLVERNRLGWLRDEMPSAAADGAMLFLGSPFAERSMMSADGYCELVGRICDAHPGMIYRPHRDEADDKLDMLRQRTGLAAERAPGTIELALTSASALPNQIMSFFSSATVTLQVLIGDRVTVGSYALRPDDFVPGWFATGDGLPTLLDQTAGLILVEPIPGRSQRDLDPYRQQIRS